jgi:hypothetical protein
VLEGLDHEGQSIMMRTTQQAAIRVNYEDTALTIKPVLRLLVNVKTQRLCIGIENINVLVTCIWQP